MELSETGEVSRLEEVTLSFNLENDKLLKKNKKEYLEEFSEIMHDITDASLEPVEANILLDTGLAFLNIIPVDFSEKNSNINSHILRDLSNYFPDSQKDFNLKCIRLNHHTVSESIDEVLMIAVSKIKTEFLKSICNSCNIIIKKIEIDQFAVEKYIRIKKKPAKAFLIIGYRNNRLDFSLILNGVLKYYNFEITERNNFKLSLLRQLNFFTGNFGSMKISDISIYGEEKITELNDFLKECIRSIPGLGINVDLLYDTGIHESKYAPLYGLAVSSGNPA